MTWIQLLTEEPDLLVVVQRLAPYATPVRIADRPGVRSATTPAAVVVASSSGRIQFIQRTLEDMKTHGLKARAVVLTPFSQDMALTLARLGCPRVVWLEDVSRALGSTLRPMVDADLRFVISEALLQRCGADPLLQRVVRETFLGTDCPTTVSQLAARAHCTPSTLRAHWRRSELPDSPQVLVEWAVMAALAELRSDGSKLSAVSRLLGLHETTLYRAALRRVGVPPSQVDRATLLAAMDDWLPSQAG